MHRGAARTLCASFLGLWAIVALAGCAPGGAASQPGGPLPRPDDFGPCRPPEHEPCVASYAGMSVAGLFNAGGAPTGWWAMDGMPWPLEELRLRPAAEVAEEASRRLGNPRPSRAYDHAFAVFAVGALRAGDPGATLLAALPTADALGRIEILRWAVRTHDPRFSDAMMEELARALPGGVPGAAHVLAARYFEARPSPAALPLLAAVRRRGFRPVQPGEPRRNATASPKRPDRHSTGSPGREIVVPAFPYSPAADERLSGEDVGSTFEDAIRRCRLEAAGTLAPFSFGPCEPELLRPAAPPAGRDARALVERLIQAQPPQPPQPFQPREADALAKELLLMGEPAGEAVAAALRREDLKALARSRLEALGAFLPVVEARRALLAPATKDVSIRNAAPAAAIIELRRLFGAGIAELDEDLQDEEAGLHAVTIEKRGATLAECLAELCNQAGLIAPGFAEGASWTNGYVGVYFAWKSALCRAEPSLVDWDGRKRCSIDFRRISCGEAPAPGLAPFEFKVDEVALPDGTTYRGDEVKEEGFADCAIPVEKLAANAGKISSLKGTVTVRLPREITTREVELSEDDELPEITPEGEVEWPDLYDEAWRPEISEGPFSLEVSRLSREGERWKLGYRCAWLEEGGEELSPGAVEVLDSAGRVLKALSRSEERGGFGGDEGETVNYNTSVQESEEKPARIRWTLATEFDGFDGAVELKDLRLPESSWKEQPEEQGEEEAPGDAGNGEGEGEGELDFIVE